MSRIKNYKKLVKETLEVENFDELESAADLFQYGIENGHYTYWQSQEFNTIYWRIKNKLILDGIKDEFVGVNRLDLLNIIVKAPVSIKEDKRQLESYIKNIKRILNKQKIA